MLENPQAVEALQSLRRETLRILLSDGRILVGTFVGTDKSMNILLVNTDEFRLGPNESPMGALSARSSFRGSRCPKWRCSRGERETVPMGTLNTVALIWACRSK